MTKLHRLIAIGMVLTILPSIVCAAAIDPSITQQEQQPQEEGTTNEKTSSVHAGWNQWDCQPLSDGTEQRRPVLMLHGLFGNGNKDGVWAAMGPYLVGKGYCVYSFTYGVQKFFKSFLEGVGHKEDAMVGGLSDIRSSAREVAQFVDRILAATGAQKVNLIGHSEGTVVSRTYIKFYGGASKVDRVALLAPLTDGTSAYGFTPALKDSGFYPFVAAMTDMAGYESVAQMVKGSSFLEELKAGRESEPEVRYLSILTKYDGIVTPPESGLLKNSQGQLVTSSSSSSTDAQGSNVFNQWVQDWCPNSKMDHMEMTSSPVVMAGVYQFFNPQANVEIVC
ncbi:hypothetical protein BGW41_002990 [Actinomortierella wolfii]|nr:hypothetical protein BGW41_002990 [Actinomortierella wolfii]